MEKPIINVDELSYIKQQQGDKFEAQIAPVANQVGAKKLGYRVVIVPPGKRAWPYHSHFVNEEMFFILEGQGTLRHAGKEHPIRSGDFIASPADPEQPHQIINTSDTPLKYMCVSTAEEPDVFLYPDSKKFGVYAGSAPGGYKNPRNFAVFSRKENGVPYWDGEE